MVMKNNFFYSIFPLRLKIRYCILISCFLMSFVVLSQNHRVVGNVYDSNGVPIIGATIKIKSSSLGTVTDEKGQFIFENLDPNAILEISYVGYQNLEYPVNNQTNLSIELNEDTELLDEIVVVGYGTQRKVNLTGAVTSIDISKVAETRPLTNLSTSLAGLAPGLFVRSSNNDPGSSASLLVRGQGTLSNSAPLVIIDGVEGDISRIAPQDVANISVLKDAASSAIYGSRAANGVILITTKRGELGKIVINYDGYYSSQSVSKKMPFVSNSVRYMELTNEAAKNSNMAQVFSNENIELWRQNEGGDPLLWPNSDWNDMLFRSTSVMNHNFSASGGTESLKSYISFNYSSSPGIIENTGYERYSVRSSNQLTVTPWLEIGLNLNGTITDKDRGSSRLASMFENSTTAVPTVVARHPDGRFGATNNSEDNPGASAPNVLDRIGDDNSHTVNTKLYFNLNPIEGLNMDGSYNYNFFVNKLTTIPVQIDKWNFQTNTISAPGSNTVLFVENQESRNVRNFMDFTTSYEKNVLNDKLYYKVMIGASQEQYKAETFFASKQNLIDAGLTQIDAATGAMNATGNLTDWAMASVFGRVNLSWLDRYLFEFNVRRDGSSRFLENNRWGTFPSASAAWRISEEPFLDAANEEWLDNLKLRVSYGSLGNNATSNYESIPILGVAKYVLNNVPTLGFYQPRIANSNLTWETTTVSNLGIDFGFFKNKLSGSIDVYDKFTHNILINLPAPFVHGNAGLPTQNSAQVRNRGLEVNLGWRDNIDEFGYFFETNFSYNKNKVEKFKGDEYSLNGIYMIKEGLPINTAYILEVDRIVQTQEDLNLVQQMVDNAQLDENGNKMSAFPFGIPKMGDFLYKDTNNDGLINDNDRVNVGSGSNPLFFYSFSIGANYKGFDASVFMDGVGGTKEYFSNDFYTPILRWTRIINGEIADGRWYEGRNTPATYPRLMMEGNTLNLRSSDFWYKSNSFFKIRNIQVGYTLPQNVVSKIDVTRLRLYVGLENYFTFSKWNGLDPEVPGMNYPSMKQAVFGINLTL